MDSVGQCSLHLYRNPPIAGWENCSPLDEAKQLLLISWIVGNLFLPFPIRIEGQQTALDLCVAAAAFISYAA